MTQLAKASYRENRFERAARLGYRKFHAAGYNPCVIPALLIALSASILLYAMLGMWSVGAGWVIMSAAMLPVGLALGALLYIGWRKHHQYLLAQDLWCLWCSKETTVYFMKLFWR